MNGIDLNKVYFESLSLVNEESDFLVIEIHKAILLMDSMASKIITHEHMPKWIIFFI